MVHRRSGVWMLFCAVLIVAATSALSADVAAARFDGRPKFHEGDALGYFVWKEGDTWKLRWTTFGSQHRFSGRILVDGGEVASMKRIDADTERKVVAPGRAPHIVRGPGGRVRRVEGGRPAVVKTKEEDKIEQENEHEIRFNTRTDDDIDGVDFKVTSATRRVRFILEIDGAPKPAEVEIGRENFKPKDHPLIAQLR